MFRRQALPQSEASDFSSTKLGSASPTADRVVRFLNETGRSMPLDDVLDFLGGESEAAYDVVANLVRRRFVAVEFEAAAKPFPHRDIVVRLLVDEADLGRSGIHSGSPNVRFTR